MNKSTEYANVKKNCSLLHVSGPASARVENVGPAATWLAGVRARSNLNIQIGQISIATLNEHQYDEARHE